MNNAEQKSIQELLQEIEDLKYRLEISEETLLAIQTGSVDAIAINGTNGPQIFTLHSADQTYRSLVERMNEGAVILNEAGVITYCNSQFSSLINIPLQKAIGASFEKFLPIDYHNQFYNIFKKGWKEQAKGEFILQPPGGEILHVFLSINAIDTPEGTVLGMIVTDLTFQKERKNLESLFSQAPSVVNIFKGPDHIIELPHPSTLKMLGRDIKGLKAKEVLTGIYDPKFFEVLDLVYKSGIPQHEFEVSSKEKETEGIVRESYFNISYLPWLDIFKNVQGVMTFAIDVTEQVGSRKKAEENARYFKNLMESIPQMTWTNTPDAQEEFFNFRWYEYLGYEKSDHRNWQWEDVIHPEDFTSTMDAYMHSMKLGIVYEIENRYKRASDGVYRWHISKSLPLKNNAGEIVLWVGTATDIHDQKIMRERMLAMNVELSRKNEELLKINNDLDNFVYTASHDLKAPVSNIEGLVGALSEAIGIQNQESEDITYILGLINDSISRFKETILDLTEITKIQKSLEEDKEIISCKEIIEDVKVDIRDMIHQSRAKINIDLTGWSQISFSKKNFKSIIFNLLSNAIKYKSFERDPEVLIKTERVEDYLLLIVKDNGLGMDLKKESKIFSMFKRLHDHVEGTGVGLYLVKRIIDNSGGKVEVESEVGIGSTFKIYFKI